MQTFFGLAVLLAIAAACAHTALALDYFVGESRIRFETIPRRLMLCVGVALASLSINEPFPRGPLFDALFWGLMVMSFGLDASQGWRLFLLLMIVTLVMRLALLGLLPMLK